MKRAHANDLKLAEIDTWKGPEPKAKRREMRKTTLVDSGEEESDYESDNDERILRGVELMDSNRQREIPVSVRHRVEMEADNPPPPSTGEESSGGEWDTEDEIPLSQLQERMAKQTDETIEVEVPIKRRLRGAVQRDPQKAVLEG